MRPTALSILVAFALADILPGQSPKPVIVQAATPAVTSAQEPAAAPDNSGAIQAALKMLQDMKATNEETLRKQAAALEQLDELGKAADQLKVYTKRN